MAIGYPVRSLSGNQCRPTRLLGYRVNPPRGTYTLRGRTERGRRWPSRTTSDSTTSTTTIQSGTVEGLIEFFDWAVAKGYAPAPTATAQKSAVRQFFATVEGESVDLSQIDVQNVDMDDLLRRFEVKARGTLKAESITTYKSRVARAIEAYRRFLEDRTPPSYRQGARRKETPEEREKPAKTNGNGNGNGYPAAPTVATLDYPFPLRSSWTPTGSRPSSARSFSSRS